MCTIAKKDLHRLKREHIISVPFFAKRELLHWQTFVEELSYRDCSRRRYGSFIGIHDVKRNMQSELRTFGKKVQHLIEQAATDELFADRPLHFNLLSVTKLEPGKKHPLVFRKPPSIANVGIHILVSGNAVFFSCKDKRGNDACVIPVRPGDAVLIRANGLYGEHVSPCYGIRDVIEQSFVLDFQQKIRRRK